MSATATAAAKEDGAAINAATNAYTLCEFCRTSLVPGNPRTVTCDGCGQYMHTDCESTPGVKQCVRCRNEQKQVGTKPSNSTRRPAITHYAVGMAAS